MKSLPMRLSFLGLMLLLAAAPADAQRRSRRAAATLGPRVGAHMGYNLDVEDLLVGAQVTWPFTPRAAFYPSFDYYFVDPGSLWSLNADLRFKPPSRYGMLYVGGGLNYSRSGSNGYSSSDTGINILAGIENGRTHSAPYVEAKLILNDGSSFQIVGGFSFR